MTRVGLELDLSGTRVRLESKLEWDSSGTRVRLEWNLEWDIELDSSEIN